MTDDEWMAAGDFSRATIAQADDFARRVSPDEAARMRAVVGSVVLVDEVDPFPAEDGGEPAALTAGADVSADRVEMVIQGWSRPAS